MLEVAQKQLCTEKDLQECDVLDALASRSPLKFRREEHTGDGALNNGYTFVSKPGRFQCTDTKILLKQVLRNRPQIICEIYGRLVFEMECVPSEDLQMLYHGNHYGLYEIAW